MTGRKTLMNEYRDHTHGLAGRGHFLPKKIGKFSANGTEDVCVQIVTSYIEKSAIVRVPITRFLLTSYEIIRDGRSPNLEKLRAAASSAKEA